MNKNNDDWIEPNPIQAGLDVIADASHDLKLAYQNLAKVYIDAGNLTAAANCIEKAQKVMEILRGGR